MNKAKFLKSIESFKKKAAADLKEKDVIDSFILMFGSASLELAARQSHGNDINLFFNLLKFKYEISDKTLKKIGALLLKELGRDNHD